MPSQIGVYIKVDSIGPIDEVTDKSAARGRGGSLVVGECTPICLLLRCIECYRNTDAKSLSAVKIF